MPTVTVRPTRAESVLRAWLEAAVVVASSVAVVAWLDPGGLVSTATPTGGDMGAHVWGPAFLRDELLPSGSLRGWSPDWYAGMPAGHFYMVVPYLLVVVADAVLPSYNVAFKLVAISGVATMPAAAWLMGRLAGWPRLLRSLLPAALLLFVFDVNFTIYGGNAASTLAGEFAFSIALSATLVYLGMFWRSLERGTGRARASLLLAFVALCHPIPLVFAVTASILMVAVRGLHALPERIGRLPAMGAAVAAIVLWAAVWNVTEAPSARLAVPVAAVAALLATEWRRSAHALVIGIIGGALSAFWTVPFVVRRAYLNDMGWERLASVREHLFLTDEISGDGTHHSITWLLVLAGVGAVVGLARWYRPALTWSAIAVTMAMGFIHWPQHRLWNARILPFWYLAVYVLAAMGLWLLIDALTRRDASRPETSGIGLATAARWVRTLVPVAALAAAASLLAVQLGDAPGVRRDADGAYRWGPFTVSPDDRNFVGGWARWNFRGYEERPDYPEYHEFVTAMSDIGDTPDYGCGRLLWEYDREIVGAYGTPMAPMLLPHWTDGCLASMEGLFFESTQTVPFHFINQDELSAEPSRPVRAVPYGGADLSAGVAHMQLFGVRYYMAFSEALIAEARAHEGLTEVVAEPPWVMFEVADSPLVSPLAAEPVVVSGAGGDPDRWLEVAIDFYTAYPGSGATDPEAGFLSSAAVLPAAAGPDRWAEVSPGAERPVRSLEEIEVREISATQDSIGFRVSRTGVPVLVKASYFPNWQVDGAAGPYRVAPNFMVVVPDENEVTLSYGWTPVDVLAWVITAIGLIVALVLWRNPHIWTAEADRRAPWE